jgi:C4-dicarboxylate transporter, DctM subunit
LGTAGFLAVFIAIVLFLGCLIDSASIMLIVLPLMLPVAKTLGIDLVWFGVITVVAVEIGLLTPPFGISVYVVKSTLNDARITLWDMFAGTQPFTLIMVAVLMLIIAFPQIPLFFQ